MDLPPHKQLLSAAPDHLACLSMARVAVCIRVNASILMQVDLLAEGLLTEGLHVRVGDCIM